MNYEAIDFAAIRHLWWHSNNQRKMKTERRQIIRKPYDAGLQPQVTYMHK